MEMSVIGARNVALLAYNQWYSYFDKIDEIELNSDSVENVGPNVNSAKVGEL